MIIEAKEGSAATARPLVVRLRNFIGDVVLGVPALRLLQQHGHELHCFGRAWAPGLLEGEGWSVQVQPGPRLARVRQMRAFRGAPSVVFPFSFSSALEARLAGLKPIGYAYEGRRFLLSRSLPLPTGVHELVRYWSLACAFLGIEADPPDRIDLHLSTRHQAEADAQLQALGLVPGRFVMVCPFALGHIYGHDKRWPHFADFTQALLGRGVPVLACPGPGEASQLEGWDPRLVIGHDIRLGPLAGIARRAAVVVSNDTGPAHLAAAVGAPVISVLGATPIWQWAPWGPTVRVVQRWPEWPSVDRVLDETARFWPD